MNSEDLLQDPANLIFKKREADTLESSALNVLSSVENGKDLTTHTPDFASVGIRSVISKSESGCLVQEVIDVKVRLRCNVFSLFC